MDWTQYIWGIIAAAVIIPVIGAVIKKIYYWSKTDKAEISLEVSHDLLHMGKFGLLHVRDGKDEYSSNRPHLHRVLWFNETKQWNNLKTSVRYIKNLGFQFKCFIDYVGIDFNQLRESLEKEGYLEVKKGKGKLNRAWFIHPEYPIYKTADGIKNNFFYPE